jgi:hypothetical protein
VFFYQPYATEGTWYSTGGTWLYRKAFKIDHNKVSGGSVLTSVPVVLSLRDSDFKSTSNGGKVGMADGTDIFFTSSDGTTKIAHEVESYSPTTGQVVVWVNIDSLSPTTDTVVYMYFGNSSASDMQTVTPTKTSVWDTGFTAVYHLPDGTTLNTNDSTSLALNLTNVNTVRPLAGQIGGAGKFSTASGNYLTHASDPAYDGSDFTLALWVEVTGSNSTIFVSRGVTTSSPGQYSFYLNASHQLSVNVPFTKDNIIVGRTSIDFNRWYYAVVTKSGTIWNLYLNGVLDAATVTDGTSITSSGPFYVGAYIYAATQLLDGNIDEVQISNIARSADWVKTEYNNQLSPSTFCIVSGTLAKTSQHTFTSTIDYSTLTSAIRFVRRTVR